MSGSLLFTARDPSSPRNDGLSPRPREGSLRVADLSCPILRISGTHDSSKEIQIHQGMKRILPQLVVKKEKQPKGKLANKKMASIGGLTWGLSGFQDQGRKAGRRTASHRTLEFSRLLHQRSGPYSLGLPRALGTWHREWLGGDGCGRGRTGRAWNPAPLGHFPPHRWMLTDNSDVPQLIYPKDRLTRGHAQVLLRVESLSSPGNMLRGHIRLQINNSSEIQNFYKDKPVLVVCRALC